MSAIVAPPCDTRQPCTMANPNASPAARRTRRGERSSSVVRRFMEDAERGRLQYVEAAAAACLHAD
jgi:hypothetical protein